jgi:3-methyladenine DNA glycosylase/8-oxoguanine DNA glycosylase
MATRLTIPVPEDFVLSRDVCSYGYFILAPNHWQVRAQTLTRALHLTEGPAKVTLAQEPLEPPRRAAKRNGDAAHLFFPHRPGAPLRAAFDRALSAPERREAKLQIARMLRLDEDAAHAAAFHALDPRWKPSGRARLFRSPTLFEDVIKTVTSCNVTWPSTVNMNRRLCDVLGKGGAFPTPLRMARARPGTLRARCRVGYRDQRLVELAGLFVPRGKRPPEVDEVWLTDPATPDDDVFKFLKSLPGIGPYAAGNIMMLLGRYSRLALDTESIRHGKTILGYKGADAAIMKKLAAHYEPFGPFKFKSYWFELWDFYEAKRGFSHNWDRDEVGKSFTASQF